jgi:DNA-binding FrmR family transcriptional regulator
VRKGARSIVKRDRTDLIKRMNKIEGQVKGITKMMEEERYCVDILLQISAARAALKKVGLGLLESHTRGCVSQAFSQGREDESIEELIKIIDQFVK